MYGGMTLGSWARWAMPDIGYSIRQLAEGGMPRRARGRPQQRRLRGAAIEGQCAARMEGTPGRWLQGARQIALDHAAPAVAIRARRRHGGEQRLRIRVQRPAEDHASRSLFDDPAEIHDRNRIRDMPHYADVVRHEQIGQPEPHLHLREQVDHLCPYRDVERGYRLVGDDEIGPQHQRPGDADAPALAAGNSCG